MVACRFCAVEMNASASCTAVSVVIRAGTFEPIPYGSEPGLEGVTNRCHGCDVLPGGYHHRGCDMEVCPACGGQLINWDLVLAHSRGRWSVDHFCGETVVAMNPAVLDGSAVPLLVANDTNGIWQVLDGSDIRGTDPVFAVVDDITDIDPSLDDVADLPVGWWAERASAGGVWTRYRPRDDEA